MIERFNSENIVAELSCLKKMLRYCHETSSKMILPDAFYEKKLSALCEYLKDGKSYFLVAKEHIEITGFLWAYEMNRDGERVMHIAYLAVSTEFQEKGIGSALMNAIETLAKELGIGMLELNVNASNAKAISFYKNKCFENQSIKMIKRM